MIFAASLVSVNGLVYVERSHISELVSFGLNPALCRARTHRMVIVMEVFPEIKFSIWYISNLILASSSSSSSWSSPHLCLVLLVPRRPLLSFIIENPKMEFLIFSDRLLVDHFGSCHHSACSTWLVGLSPLLPRAVLDFPSLLLTMSTILEMCSWWNSRCFDWNPFGCYYWSFIGFFLYHSCGATLIISSWSSSLSSICVANRTV